MTQQQVTERGVEARIAGAIRRAAPFIVKVDGYTVHRSDGPVLRFFSEEGATSYAERLANSEPRSRVEVYCHTKWVAQVAPGRFPLSIPVLWEG